MSYLIPLMAVPWIAAARQRQFLEEDEEDSYLDREVQLAIARTNEMTRELMRKYPDVVAKHKVLTKEEVEKKQQIEKNKQKQLAWLLQFEQQTKYSTTTK